MTLRKQALAAVRWTSAGSLARSVVAFGQLVVLSRLVPTAELGLVALALAVINTVNIISDIGLSNAIIHYSDTTEDELSSLFWLNISSGLILSILLAVFSPILANLYNEPRLFYLFLALSPFFFIVSLSQQQKALAEKSLRFKPLAICEFLSTALGFIVAVSSAYFGAGAYSIVLGMLSLAALNAVFAWSVLSKGWKPTFHFKLKETLRYLRHGGYLILGSIVNTLTLQGDVIVSGKMLPHSALGLYSLPRDLCMKIMFVINPIITRIGLPLIAKSQHDPELVKRIYLKTLRMTASINFPIYGFIALYSSEIVKIIFGAKWNDAGILLRLLALWCLVRSIGNPIGSLLTATGRTKRAFVSGFSVMLVLYPTVIYCSKFGIEGVPTGLFVLYLALIIPFWYFLARPACRATFTEYHIQLVVPAITTALACTCAYFCAESINNDLIRLSVGGGSGAVAYLASSFLLNRSWFNSMLELAHIKSAKSV
jgi:O-antigen/teichoic acid export membrane protein